MYKKTNTPKIFLFVVAMFFFGGFIYAQENKENAIITLDPSSSGPNQQITARLVSFDFDINTAHITWTRNGSVSLSGVGSKVFRFTTGKIGATESLRAVARTIDGKEFIAEKVFIIGDVDLLWSTETSIPPEYGGKALPTPGSFITVAAFPQFFVGSSKISDSTLTYEWFLGGREERGASGPGKSTFRFRAGTSPSVTHAITVKISSPKKSIISEKSVFISITEPEIYFYEERPLEGPHFGRTLTQRTMQRGGTMSVRALPYFFSLDGLSKLEYRWTVDNTDVENITTPHIFDIQSAEKSGSSVVSVAIKHIQDIFQRASAQFTIHVR